MEIGNFKNNWRNEGNFTQDHCGNIYWKYAEPLTSKGLLGCKTGINDFIFRLPGSTEKMYAEKTLRSYELFSKGLIKSSFELSIQNIKEVWIKNLFLDLPDFPRKIRENPFDGVVTKESPWKSDETYAVEIYYGDPYKLGGHSEPYTGKPNLIKERMLQLEDYMWHIMNCNGNPYIGFKHGEQKYNRQFKLITPNEVSGRWIRENYKIMANGLNSIACNVFKGRPSASDILTLKVEELLVYIDDNKIYKTSGIENQEYYAWHRFNVEI